MLQNNKTNIQISTRPELEQQLKTVSAGCIQCQTCVTECQFLQHYGDPKTLAENYNSGDERFLHLPFECSLCNLCTAVCPHGVEPAEMFLEMRRESFEKGQTDRPEHRALRSYEKKGTSKRFSWYALPEQCDTIFFPGCSLSGSRSETTLKVFEYLQREIPNIGIVLDCCTKPSHDLGDEAHFNAMFGEMKSYLLANGIKTILLACPNCDKVFRTHGKEFNVQTVYEVLAQLDNLPATKKLGTAVALHDPCTARFNFPAQNGVRKLLNRQKITVIDQPHSGVTTFCCGEGGAVNCVKSEFSDNWSNKRLSEATGHPIVSYCAGCTEILGKQTETSHILDLLFNDSDKKLPVASSPLTYFKRLRLKKYLQQHVHAHTARERTFHPGSQRRIDKGRVLFFLMLLSAIVPGLFLLLK